MARYEIGIADPTSGTPRWTGTIITAASAELAEGVAATLGFYRNVRLREIDRGSIQQLEAANRELAELVKELEAALEAIKRMQQSALEIIRKHGFVFSVLASDLKKDSTPAERWQVLAFSLYGDLCQAESIARAALAGKKEYLE